MDDKLHQLTIHILEHPEILDVILKRLEEPVVEGGTFDLEDDVTPPPPP